MPNFNVLGFNTDVSSGRLEAKPTYSESSNKPPGMLSALKLICCIFLKVDDRRVVIDAG